MDCPFCIIKKEDILFESENCIVILSNPRLVPGHLLVIPKKHIEKLSELNERERAEIFNTMIQFQEKILEKFAGGCDIRQHYRPFQKQNNLKVNHLHIHLQPREFQDELYEKCQRNETEIFRNLTPEEVTKYRSLFFSL